MSSKAEIQCRRKSRSRRQVANIFGLNEARACPLGRGEFTSIVAGGLWGPDLAARPVAGVVTQSLVATDVNEEAKEREFGPNEGGRIVLAGAPDFPRECLNLLTLFLDPNYTG